MPVIGAGESPMWLVWNSGHLMAASTNSHELYSLGPTRTNSTPEAYLPGFARHLAGLYCVVYACKTFLRVRNGDVASQQGVGSWTPLGSEA